MNRKSLLLGAALATGLAAAAVAYVPNVSAQPYGGGWGMRDGYGPGWMHRGWRDDCPGYGAGYGPRARGDYGPGWMHRYGYGPRSGSGTTGSRSGEDLKLTTEDVKERMERWLSRRDNPRLKLGEVVEKDADTIEASIVTKDNSVVERFSVNRHTGYMRSLAE